MVSVVHRLHELAKEKNLPLYMGVIDLQKAHDSVDRYFLWKIVARHGIPPQENFHHPPIPRRQRACVRVDSGETSEWFNVNQGFRQGCVIFPGLFNIFFAAMPTVTFDRLLINKAVAQDFIRIAERGRNTRDELGKLLWAMLYADDAGIASRSWVSLTKIMASVVEVCAAFGLVVAEKKTVTLHMRSPNMEAGTIEVETASQR
ncbi:unnamed protein product [Sphacelaria rigidula]